MPVVINSQYNAVIQVEQCRWSNTNKCVVVRVGEGLAIGNDRINIQFKKIKYNIIYVVHLGCNRKHGTSPYSLCSIVNGIYRNTVITNCDSITNQSIARQRNCSNKNCK